MGLLIFDGDVPFKMDSYKPVTFVINEESEDIL